MHLIKTLEERLKFLESRIAQCMADLNMLLGGKEETLFWLNHHKKEEPSAEVKPAEQKTEEPTKAPE